MPIQIVHDIETGYGDPLRVKATPDLSLRFLDESYAAENALIADIQRRLEAWYTARDTPLAQRGLRALSNTLAGIYFIPFKTGASLQFSFSGQSIPNRSDVAEALGIKIYFDPIETEARVAINKQLIKKVRPGASRPPSQCSFPSPSQRVLAPPRPSTTFHSPPRPAPDLPGPSPDPPRTLPGPSTTFHDPLRSSTRPTAPPECSPPSHRTPSSSSCGTWPRTRWATPSTTCAR